MKNRILGIFFSILSGILAGLSFPFAWGDFVFEQGCFLAWVAFVPLLTVLQKTTIRKSFKRSFVCGLVLYSIQLSWFFPTLLELDQLARATGMAGIASFIIMASVTLGLHVALTKYLEQHFSKLAWLMFPLSGVVLAFILNYFPFDGFPWINFAYTQSKSLPLIQVLDIMGIYGLLFLILLINRLLAAFLISLVDHQTKQMFQTTIVVFCIFSFLLLYGSMRIHTLQTQLKKLPQKKVALIQANILQKDKSDPALKKEILKKYRKLSYEAQIYGLDLLAWPETASPYEFPQDLTFLPYGFGPFRTPLLFGTFTYDHPENPHFKNSAFLVDQQQRILGRADKQHLVPFGEVMPFPFNLLTSKTVIQKEQLVAGTKNQILKLEDFNLGVMICFEDLFPEIAFDFVNNKANILAVLTNDAWHQKSSAAYQHLVFSIFRAIENRTTLLRVANSGISGIVDPVGKVHHKTKIFEEKIIIGNATLGSLKPHPFSVNWFAWASVASFTLFIFLARCHRHGGLSLFFKKLF